jgi:peptidoglycan/LPS O-acetylase OafA/YrhL
MKLRLGSQPLNRGFWFLVFCLFGLAPGAPNAWIEIGLFFSLSGLLMTSMALNVYHKKGAFGAVVFWSRRVLRLLPVRPDPHVCGLVRHT